VTHPEHQPGDSQEHPAAQASAPSGFGAELAERAKSGDRLALTRLLTAIESRTPVAEEAMRVLFAGAIGSQLVGVTGPPGGGKSTLVAALVAEARKADRAVAVLAIDPSSPVTGGAILGDRIRMQHHAADRDVFIRSMASRGHLGGLAGTTTEAAAALAACGFKLVFIETVGTGQSEVEVAAIADTTVVVQAPEMGDEIQAIKAGLLEVADVVVVNKSDRPGADRAAAQLRAMLTVSAAADEAAAAAGRATPKRPEIRLASGLNGDGVEELLAALDRHHQQHYGTGRPLEKRVARARMQIEGIIADRMRAQLWSGADRARTDEVLEAVAFHQIDPYEAADRLMARLDDSR
jgi:LAO/AO transport system kinase